MVNSLPVMNNKSLILRFFHSFSDLYWRTVTETITEIYLLLTFKKDTTLSAQKQNVKQEVRAPRDSYISSNTPREHQGACLASMSKCKCNLCFSVSLESEAQVVQTAFLNLILKSAIFTDIIYLFLRNKQTNIWVYVTNLGSFFSKFLLL